MELVTCCCWLSGILVHCAFIFIPPSFFFCFCPLFFFFFFFLLDYCFHGHVTKVRSLAQAFAAPPALVLFPTYPMFIAMPRIPGITMLSCPCMLHQAIAISNSFCSCFVLRPLNIAHSTQCLHSSFASQQRHDRHPLNVVGSLTSCPEPRRRAIVTGEKKKHKPWLKGGEIPGSATS
ncbi:hypothetical protein M440DRAFT_301496 [Trichoderma longibrachiatum ATCC 18648]|uniref:Uncharacterized protein n=1 Tax=Trichoderma longibrachiatum ATCC 18648 TaxID=983965 RepID=A0A2T4C5D0_TRILO|nr:hypothetical protein M440DRAFT_301496 [Trichoderma longibrachiatum ATCC 18648]